MSRLASRLWDILLGRVPRSDRLGGMVTPESAALACGEGLGGMLYRRLLEHDSPLQTGTGDLACAYHETAAGNLFLLRELAHVLAALGDLADRVLVLPGAALLPLYPDLGCRPMDDVDLLVAPDHGAAVRRVLRAAGMRSPRRHPNTLVGERLTLDLHEQVLNEDRVPSRRRAGTMAGQALWQTRRSIDLDGIAVTAASLEDEFVYSAAHAVRHGYSRLTWLSDMVYLCQGTLDWRLLRERAQRYALTRPVLYALDLLQRQLGCCLPADAAGWLAAEPLGRFEQPLLRRAFADGGAGEWGDLLWSCGMPGRGARLLFLAETAFPRAGVLLQVFPFLPRPLAPLAYLLRVFQLVLRGVRLGARLLRRRTP